MFVRESLFWRMYFLRYLRVSRSTDFLAVCWYCQPLNRYGWSMVVSSCASLVRSLLVPTVFSMFSNVAYCRFVKASCFWRFWSCWISW